MAKPEIRDEASACVEYAPLVVGLCPSSGSPKSSSSSSPVSIVIYAWS